MYLVSLEIYFRWWFSLMCVVKGINCPKVMDIFVSF